MYLNHCRLLAPFTGGMDYEKGYVEVQDGKIVSVGEALPAQARDVIDCEGKTLLPGLIDLHTHLTFLGGVGVSEANDPMELLISAARRAGQYLQYGFTTIRDCGSIKRSANYVKKLIDEGLLEGPDILACGETLMPSVVDHKSSLSVIIHYCDGAEEFRKGVREEVAGLADFIKIYASGSAMNPTGVPKNPIMTYEEIRTAVETAAANDLYVAAHCHADQAIQNCIRAGVRTIEHATYLGEETVDMLLSSPDVYLVPTFSAMYVSQTEPKERAFWLARLTPMLENCAQAIEKAYRTGAKLGFGTDSAPLSPQYEQGVEFRFRKEYCHMENVDILLQATKWRAQIAGIQERVGEIKAGMQADLILVEGDPVRDLSVMYQPPVKVWKKGKLVKGGNN